MLALNTKAVPLSEQEQVFPIPDTGSQELCTITESATLQHFSHLEMFYLKQQH
jgi:hypothetical protein